MEKSERRKKIISRGTDRLALITGRIQTLDPDPLIKSTSFSTPRRDLPPVIHSRSTSEPGVADQEPLLPDDHLLGANSPDPIKTRDIDEELPKGNNSELRFSNQGSLGRKEAARLKPEGHCFSLITANEVNFCIISSEDTRAVCSAVLAFLVVLSYVTLPPNAVKPKSLLAHTPLYVVLLTDMFIICVKLARYVETRKECGKEASFEEDEGNWGGAVKLLELGVVMHQTIRALFIDCSFYLVVVVCGLSML